MSVTSDKAKKSYLCSQTISQLLQELPINSFSICLVAAFPGVPHAYHKKLHRGADQTLQTVLCYLSIQSMSRPASCN